MVETDTPFCEMVVLRVVFETFSARAATVAFSASVLTKMIPVFSGAGHTVILAYLPV
jgi:hypothetical protein